MNKIIIDYSFHFTIKPMKRNISDMDNDVEKAFELFPYFDTWSRKTIADCCRLSKIKVIPPDGIILGSEDQESGGVHFIMAGSCRLIEHLSLVQETSNGEIKYSIFRDKNIDRQISASDQPKYSSILFNMENTDSLENESKENCEGRTEKEPAPCVENLNAGISESEVAINDETEESHDNAGVATGEKDATEEVATKEKPEIKETNKFSQFYRRMLPYITAKNKILREKSGRAESHFLQIALIHKGCCLGLGENLRNRYLVSVTEVTCMVIPLQFLLQHNPNNIWNRIKQFLNDYLPKEGEVLSEFVINMKWNECKRKLVTSKCVSTSTKMSDVPISIRLNDANMRLDLFRRMFVQPALHR